MAIPHSRMSRLTPGVGPGSTSKPSSVELERRIQDLETMAAWREELADRIRRTELCFEFVGLDPEDQDRLHHEVESFKCVCRLLAESGSVAP